MAHANYIDCHMDFFTLLGLTQGGGEQAASDNPDPSSCCSMNVDHHHAATNTTTLVQLHNQSDNGGLHRQPQAFTNLDRLIPEDKENTGLVVNGFLHVNGTGLNKVGFLHNTEGPRGMKRFCESEESNFLNGEEAPSKRQCLEENGRMALPNGSDLLNVDVPLPDVPAVPGDCAEMTCEPATIETVPQTPANISSLCSQCGKKKHKKFCTGYMEEMTSSSASLMPCAQCLSGQSGHLEHITATRMDMS